MLMILRADMQRTKEEEKGLNTKWEEVTSLSDLHFYSIKAKEIPTFYERRAFFLRPTAMKLKSIFPAHAHIYSSTRISFFPYTMYFLFLGDI